MALALPRRHQLVRLSAAGWTEVRQQADARAWNADALSCLDAWQAQSLPLVVATQRPGMSPDTVSLGLPTPVRWSRQRLGVQVARTDLQTGGEFPPAADIACLLPASLQAPWRHWCAGLAQCGAHVDAHVYGSYGWQQLTGQAYLRPQSDLDLLVSLGLDVDQAQVADRVTAWLQRVPFDAPRLDGELMLADGSAVAWREWAAWRSGQTEQILVRRWRGVALESGTEWLARAAQA